MDINNKKATRQSYGEALVELGKVNKDVIVLDADGCWSTCHRRNSYVLIMP